MMTEPGKDEVEAALEEAREFVRNLRLAHALREHEHYSLIAIIDKAEAASRVRTDAGRAAVIEECAKVADDLSNRWGASLAHLEAEGGGTKPTLAVMAEAIRGVKSIAAAIHALAARPAAGAVGKDVREALARWSRASKGSIK